MSANPNDNYVKYPAAASYALCASAFFPDMPPNAIPETYCNPEPYYSVDRKRILGGLMNSIDPVLQASMGLCKENQYLSGAGATSTAGLWFCAIVCLADTTLDVAAGGTTEKTGYNNIDVNLAPLSAVLLPKGTILYGNFDKVKLVNGLVKLIGHPFH